MNEVLIRIHGKFVKLLIYKPIIFRGEIDIIKERRRPKHIRLRD